MPNKNYIQGRAREYATMRMLEDLGETAFRTAGSHGCADVISVTANQVRLIQIKSGVADLTPAELETFKELPVPASVSKEVWYWKKIKNKWVVNIKMVRFL